MSVSIQAMEDMATALPDVSFNMGGDIGNVIEVDNFEQPSKELNLQKFILTANKLTYLHIPAGFITAIKAKEDNSKLLVLADYPIGSSNDEYRYDLNYFKIETFSGISKS
jgi:hypothetical protein